MAARKRGATLALLGLNAGMRLVIVGVVGHALLNPNDPRYAGKAIGTRGLALVAASFLVPALQLTTRRGKPYPLTTDTLHLSIYALDLAGNQANLYDRYKYFDAIPHFHGTGAATLVFADLLDRPLLSAVGVAQVGHVLLEAQEYYSDVIFGLRNVRGTWDTVNDLLAGAAGSAVYAWIAHRRRRRTLD